MGIEQAMQRLGTLGQFSKVIANRKTHFRIEQMEAV